MNEKIKDMISELKLSSPGTIQKVDETETQLDIKFSADYKEFILEFNGAEGILKRQNITGILSLNFYKICITPNKVLHKTVFWTE